MPHPRTAVYTGSFDPITLGHLHIIRRSVALFDHLVIGIGINADKKSLFEPQRACRAGAERDGGSVERAGGGVYRAGGRFCSQHWCAG